MNPIKLRRNAVELRRTNSNCSTPTNSDVLRIDSDDSITRLLMTPISVVKAVWEYMRTYVATTMGVCAAFHRTLNDPPSNSDDSPIGFVGVEPTDFESKLEFHLMCAGFNRPC